MRLPVKAMSEWELMGGQKLIAFAEALESEKRKREILFQFNEIRRNLF